MAAKYGEARRRAEIYHLSVPVWAKNVDFDFLEDRGPAIDNIDEHS